MTEFVLVLPLLLFILALLIYFGRGMVRAQRTAVVDRYESWRSAGHAPGPVRDEPANSPQLNDAFFGDHAQSLQVELDGGFPTDARAQLVDAVYTHSVPSGELAGRIFADLPHGASVKAIVTHANGVAVWQQFEGPIRHRHVRLGNDWRGANGWRNIPAGDARALQWPSHGLWYPAGHGSGNSSAIRSSYFTTLDDALAGMSSGDNHLAGTIRGLYLGGYGYAGPCVDYR